MIAAGAVQQAQCGTEAYRAAAAAAQLVEGGGVVARLADRLVQEILNKMNLDGGKLKRFSNK